jgi:hypothetical protein
MNNAELIKALRYCGNFADRDGCDEECPYFNDNDCPKRIMCDAADAIEAAEKCIKELEAQNKLKDGTITAMATDIGKLQAQMPKEGEWIMDENPHDGDCRCSVCLIAIDAMHERNHELLNALTGGKWWTFYHYCPKCGARMKGEEK